MVKASDGGQASVSSSSQDDSPSELRCRDEQVWYDDYGVMLTICRRRHVTIRPVFSDEELDALRKA
jgi:hypothetical protein